MKPGKFVNATAMFSMLCVLGCDSKPAKDPANNRTDPATVAPTEQASPPADLIPEPVLRVDFESRGEVAQKLAKNRHLEIVKGAGVNGSVGLRAAYVPYEMGSQRIVGRFKIPPAEEYTLQFDVKFEPGFDFAHGGKLHGFGPSRPVTGGKPMHKDGWSSRAMFKREGGIKLYNYHHHKPGRFGESGVVQDADFRFSTNRFHAVSIYLKLNDRLDSSNGVSEVHVDGRLIESAEALLFRPGGGNRTKITQFLFSTFHGGSDERWSPRDPDGQPVTVHALFDNIAVYPGRQIRRKPQ